MVGDVFCGRCSVFFVDIRSNSAQSEKKGEGTGPKKKASIKRKCQPPGSEKKKKAELAWKTKMSNITPILLAAQLTKPGKFSGVPLVRKFLIQKKKLSWKDQKTVTETNVVENGLLKCSGLSFVYFGVLYQQIGWSFVFSTQKSNLCQDLIFAVDP